MVAVAASVSLLSELEVFVLNPGLDRARAISRRASSRFLVGLDPLLCAGDVEQSVAVEEVEGSILPMNVQRHLFEGVGESVVSFGAVASAMSSLGTVTMAE